MNIFKTSMAIAAFGMVVACGAGTPATKDEAEKTLREKMADDDHDISWINAEAKEEPGDFKVFVDRVEKGKPDATETQICNATVSSNSHSYSCQSTKPNMMVQAAEVLLKDYTSRKIEVKGYHLERSGKGNAFAGYFELIDPSNGQLVKVPCKGDQKEFNSDIDCDPKYADEAG